MSNPTPPHITDRAVARVLAGERASRVAADLGVSVHTVLRACRRARVEVPAIGRPACPVAAAAVRLAGAEGITLRAAAERLSVPVRTVYNASVRRAWEGRR